MLFEKKKFLAEKILKQNQAFRVKHPSMIEAKCLSTKYHLQCKFN